MATVVTRGFSKILSNRRYEDYKSMKQRFKYSKVKEITFEGFQTMTDTAANLEPSDIAVTLIGGEATVFLFTIANDADQQGKNVWTVYVDDAGAISEPVLTVLDDADSSVPVPLGSTSANYTDAVASVDGQALTMTDLAMDTAELYVDLTGWYVIGYTADNIGTAIAIASNTKADPTVITLDSVGDKADWAADLVSVQQYAYGDFFRVRELYCAVEAHDAKTVAVGNQAANAWYGVISRDMNYMASARYFTPAETVCRSFLGRIKTSCANESTDAKKQGAEIQITLTTKSANANATASDIIIDKVFSTELDWQPCIELCGATDVNIQILRLDATNVDDMTIETTFLEVYDVNKDKT